MVKRELLAISMKKTRNASMRSDDRSSSGKMGTHSSVIVKAWSKKYYQDFLFFFISDHLILPVVDMRFQNCRIMKRPLCNKCLKVT